MKLFIPLFTLILCMSLPAIAQEDKEKKQARGRVVHFACTGIPKNLANPVLVRSGKKIIKLDINRRMASDAVKIPANGIIEWVVKSNNPDGDPYLPIARVKVPDGVRKALVILVPRREPKGTLLFTGLVQDLSSFSGGDYLFLNLTTTRVSVQMGNKKLLIRSGKHRIYRAKGLKKSTNFPVKYVYYNSAKNQWKLLSASTIVLRPTRREICIFNWDAKHQRVNYHGLTFPVPPSIDQ